MKAAKKNLSCQRQIRLWRKIVLSSPVPAYRSGRQGAAGPAQIPSGLCGVNSRGLGGIFTPHFERSEIVAGPPAEPVNEIGSDIFKYTPPVSIFYRETEKFSKLPKQRKI